METFWFGAEFSRQIRFPTQITIIVFKANEFIRNFKARAVQVCRCFGKNADSQDLAVHRTKGGNKTHNMTEFNRIRFTYIILLFAPWLIFYENCHNILGKISIVFKLKSTLYPTN